MLQPVKKRGMIRVVLQENPNAVLFATTSVFPAEAPALKFVYAPFAEVPEVFPTLWFETVQVKFPEKHGRKPHVALIPVTLFGPTKRKPDVLRKQ